MINRAGISDANIIAQMAVKLWPGNAEEELIADFKEIIAGDEAAVFLCFVENKAIGFAQCQLRYDYVEGTSTSPVGYLEGVFVEEKHRSHGYGKILVRACEQWAKEKGCAEFASDCELDNQQSLLFHLHAGFQEANRIICFAKRI